MTLNFGSFPHPPDMSGCVENSLLCIAVDYGAILRFLRFVPKKHKNHLFFAKTFKTNEWISAAFILIHLSSRHILRFHQLFPERCCCTMCRCTTKMLLNIIIVLILIHQVINNCNYLSLLSMTLSFGWSSANNNEYYVITPPFFLHQVILFLSATEHSQV